MKHSRRPLPMTALAGSGVAVAVAAGLFGAQGTAAGDMSKAQGPSVGRFELFDGRSPWKSFTTCAGLGSSNEIIEQRTVDPAGREVIRRLPGRLHQPSIVCERELSDMDLQTWRQEVIDGQTQRARKTLELRYVDRSAVVEAKWILTQSWPSGLKVVANGDGPNPVEVIDITADELTRVAP